MRCRRDPDMTPDEFAERLANAAPRTARERCDELRAKADQIEAEARANGNWDE